MQDTVTIPKEEYDSLKRKAIFADDVLLQLNSSLKDIEADRVKPAAH